MAKIEEVVCHHTWQDTTENIMNTENYQCPICHKAGQHGKETYKLDKWKKANAKQGKTTKQFVKEVEEKYGDEYTVLGHYKNSYTKIKIRHNKCGTKFMRRPNNFLKGEGCPQCAMKQRIKTRKENGIREKTTKQFKKELNEIKLNNIEVIGEYEKADIPIKMKCNDCGNVFKRKPSLLLHSFAECPKCRKARLAEKRRKQTEETILKKVNEMHGNEYTVIGKIINWDTKVLVRHNKCGRTWKVTPKHFLVIDKRRDKETGTTCPYCFEESNKFLFSKGMEKIKKYLNKNDIKYKREYYFEDLQNNGYLKFDFAVLNNLNKPRILIEYDGRQHFEPVKRFGGKKEYKKQTKRDQMKNKYCEENNIDLIRIPYWDKDKIEHILEEVI